MVQHKLWQANTAHREAEIDSGASALVSGLAMLARLHAAIERESPPRTLAMQALRVIKEPRNHQVVIDLPPDLSSAARVEVIVFAADVVAIEQESAPRTQQAPVPETSPGAVKRRPSPRLAATRITGDLMSPAAPDTDWNALK